MEDTFKEKHRIPSNRLRNYNYAANGAYFITICTKDRQHFFGEIQNGEMILNHIGKIVEKCWSDIPKHFPFAILDAFVVMPNHVHGVIWIKKQNGDFTRTKNEWINNVKTNVETKNFLSLRKNNVRDVSGKMLHGTSKTIGSIIRGFKTGVSKYCRRHTDVFQVWQPNYYDRIIRSEDELHRIHEYIICNPLKWESDNENIRNR